MVALAAALLAPASASGWDEVATRAEVRYWDEGDDVSAAIDQALRLWDDHAESAQLPKWKIVGLEVLDRETARRQWDSADRRRVGVPGEIRPFEPPV